MSILFNFQINLGMYLKDDSKEFSIMVDRSVGGSSIVDGQLELMLHRFVYLHSVAFFFYKILLISNFSSRHKP